MLLKIDFKKGDSIIIKETSLFGFRSRMNCIIDDLVEVTICSFKTDINGKDCVDEKIQSYINVKNILMITEMKAKGE